MTDSRLADKEAAALETDYFGHERFCEQDRDALQDQRLGDGQRGGYLSRLFFQEKDADMKIQIIDAIGDIEGFKEKKTGASDLGGQDRPAARRGARAH